MELLNELTNLMNAEMIYKLMSRRFALIVAPLAPHLGEKCGINGKEKSFSTLRFGST
jgi:hypothetical protein